MRYAILLVSFAGLVAMCPNVAWSLEISWRVENPFRFFADAKVTDIHRHITRKVGNTSSPILASERLLAARHPFGWAEGAFRQTCWDLRRQSHTACGSLREFVFPKSHRIVARFGDGSPARATCTWRLEKRIGRAWKGRAIRRPCHEAVRMDVPYPTGARITVRTSDGRAANTTVQVPDVFVVGLGDSYASGEGNPDRPVRWRDDRAASFGRIRDLDLSGYPSRKSTSIRYQGRQMIGPSAFWLSQPCHRSLYSHQLRVALQLALEDPHRAVTFLGLSCSGAEISTGLLTPWKGVERFSVRQRRSQIGDAAVAQCGGRRYRVRDYASSFTDGGRVPSLDGLALQRCPPERARKIDLVLLNIGGNDIGFAKLVAYSILKERTPLRRLSQATDQVFAPRDALQRFGELRSRFKLLRRALHNHLHIPWSESRRIVLTAYPTIAVRSDGRSICGAENQAGLDGFPGYRLDPRRAARAEAVASRLNDLMREIAHKYGWRFVNAHRAQFAGRGICAGIEGGGSRVQDELRLPRWTGRNWFPYRPSLYRPYSQRQRWMRTSNDAFLTAHIDLSSDVRQRLRRGRRRNGPQDLLKASTFGGAFHPTAEGQAAIADSVLPLARKVISSVGRGD